MYIHPDVTNLFPLRVPSNVQIYTKISTNLKSFKKWNMWYLACVHILKAYGAPFYTIVQKWCCALGITFCSPCILLRVSAVRKENLPLM